MNAVKHDQTCIQPRNDDGKITNMTTVKTAQRGDA